MIIDCDGCALKDIACGDCVVTVLMGERADFEPAEARAVEVLAGVGLVPPLRMKSKGA